MYYHVFDKLIDNRQYTLFIGINAFTIDGYDTKKDIHVKYIYR